ncbi:MAG: nickel pincer cofactor biosynthesis protein LarC [Roseburia sp.]|nr:nickel pincer cofactor biosynthesis protein LarC [Roseburia sp.]
MKALYLECNMGAAGDMLMAALWELLEDKQAFADKMSNLGLLGVSVNPQRSVKCGITGTHMQVLIDGEEECSGHDSGSHDHGGYNQGSHNHGGHEHEGHNQGSHEHEGYEHEGHEQGSHNHGGHEHEGHNQGSHDHESHHHHAGMHDIRHKIAQLHLPDKVKEDVLSVYRLIAEAESHVHGRPVEEIHFHEVGTADAIADIVGVCLLMEELAPDKVIVSPVHVGSGQVRCAHGILPVPAPAAAYLLRDVPTYGGRIGGELCTPTGAALLRYFASDFGDMPVMRVSRIGYGMGKKDFEQANCVRAMLGTVAEDTRQILELCCNLDDMTPEAVGFVQEELFAKGALDVYTTAVGMKKSRPGVLLTCMCRLGDREAMLQLIFRHTTTLGIRESVCNRYTLNRRERIGNTPYGTVRIKEAEGFGVRREKPEYEDLARIAREQRISLWEVSRLLEDKERGL